MDLKDNYVVKDWIVVVMEKILKRNIWATKLRFCVDLDRCEMVLMDKEEIWENPDDRGKQQANTNRSTNDMRIVFVVKICW